MGVGQPGCAKFNGENISIENCTEDAVNGYICEKPFGKCELFIQQHKYNDGYTTVVNLNIAPWNQNTLYTILMSKTYWLIIGQQTYIWDNTILYVICTILRTLVYHTSQGNMSVIKEDLGRIFEHSWNRLSE